nr:ABC transporter ATP-binding protein [Streptomyces boncukensis]
MVGLLRRCLRPYARRVVGVVLLQLVQTFALLYLPTLNASIIDDGVLREDVGHVLRTGGLMLSVTLVQVVCAGAAVYLGTRIALAVGRDVRAGVYARVQGFSAREMGRFGAPSLVTRCTNDVQQIQMLLLLGFTMVVTAPILCVGGVLLALGQDVAMSLLFLVVLPVLVGVIVLILRSMVPLSGVMQQRVDGVNRVLREQITGIRVVRAFVRERYEERRFAEANRGLSGVALRVGRLQALMNPAVMLIVEFAGMGVLWFGGHRVEQGEMQVGSLVAFLQYLSQILFGVMLATYAFQTAPRAAACAVRIREVLDTEPSVAPPAVPVAVQSRPGRLVLRDAGFRYPGAEAPVLCGIDLVAEPGTTTALVGSTGSGKSTLLRLVPRLMDATWGTVCVGGVDVRTLDACVLTRSVGMVGQRPYLFSGTVASNLRYGDPDATDAQLWRALEVAQAREFVEGLPERLEAPIGQGGSNVSGGQRQRLAIARVLVARPEIYLFDDSFSALDHATERALRAALEAEVAHATVVVVAQRIAGIRDADRIVVLERGRVVGSGTHAELFASCRTYQEMVLSQMTEQEAR